MPGRQAYMSFCRAKLDSGAGSAHLRNLLNTLPPSSLRRMALRALLFCADGDSTSTLCHVLTGHGIEAEICADLLVAVERATKGGYDAIVVDWEQQDDTIFYLKALREVKPTTPGLALALLRSDADVRIRRLYRLCGPQFGGQPPSAWPVTGLSKP